MGLLPPLLSQRYTGQNTLDEPVSETIVRADIFVGYEFQGLTATCSPCPLSSATLSRFTPSYFRSSTRYGPRRPRSARPRRVAKTCFANGTSGARSSSVSG